MIEGIAIGWWLLPLKLRLKVVNCAGLYPVIENPPQQDILTYQRVTTHTRNYFYSITIDSSFLSYVTQVVNEPAFLLNSALKSRLQSHYVNHNTTAYKAKEEMEKKRNTKGKQK